MYVYTARKIMEKFVLFQISSFNFFIFRQKDAFGKLVFKYMLRL